MLLSFVTDFMLKFSLKNVDYKIVMHLILSVMFLNPVLILNLIFLK